MFNQTIKKYVVLLLLVTYQFIGLIHTTIPRFNFAAKGHVSSVIDFVHKNHSASIPRMPFQRGFHAFNENGSKYLANPAKAFLLFFAFFLTGIITLANTKKPEGYLSAALVHSPYNYLRLRAIRI